MELQGSLIRDITRAPVGQVRAVLLHPDTLDARWLLVSVESNHSTVLVPAATASEFAPGELLVPYPADVINSAVHAEGDSLSEADATLLLRHYGFAKRGDAP